MDKCWVVTCWKNGSEPDTPMVFVSREGALEHIREVMNLQLHSITGAASINIEGALADGEIDRALHLWQSEPLTAINIQLNCVPILDTAKPAVGGIS